MSDIEATGFGLKGKNSELINKSGIWPTGGHLLVLPKKVEEVTKGGIILLDDTIDKDQRASTEGTLVAVGASAGKVGPALSEASIFSGSGSSVSP